MPLPNPLLPDLRLPSALPDIGRRRRAPRLPSPSMQLMRQYEPEEQESLLGEIGGWVGSGISTVASVLDTPGSIIRNAIAGENPLKGIFDPAERTTGRELLTALGVTSPNNPDEWEWADLAGFLAEVGTDPLIWATGPGAAVTKLGAEKGILKGATALGRAGQFSTAARRATEIEQGMRGLVGLKLPFAKTSFAALTGPKAAKAYEVLMYGPRAVEEAAGLSNPLIHAVTGVGEVFHTPIRLARQAFSTVPGMKYANKGALQKSIDAGYDSVNDALDLLTKDHFALAEKLGEHEEIYDNILKPYFRQNPQVLERVIGELPGITNNLENLDYVDFLKLVTERTAFREGDIEAEVLKNAGLESHRGLAPAIDEAMAGKYSPTPYSPFSGRAQIYEIDEASGKLASAETLMDAARAHDEYATKIREFVDGARARVAQLGLPEPMLEDLMIGHMPRNLSPAFKQIIKAARRNKTIGKDASLIRFPFNARRKDFFRDIPGGEATLNMMSKDPRISGTLVFEGRRPLNKWGKLPGAEKMHRLQILHEEYGFPMPANIGFDKAGKVVFDKRALTRADKRQLKSGLDLLEWLHEIPVDDATRPLLYTHGIFNGKSLEGALEYARHAARVEGTLFTVHSILSGAASSEPVGRNIASILTESAPRGLGLTTESLDAFANFAKQAGRETIDPYSMYVPDEFLPALSNVIKIHLDDKLQDSLWHLVDKYQGLWKGSVTLPAPAFHNRNRISGYWQNAVSAFNFTKPKLVVKAVRETAQALRGKKILTPDGKDLVELADAHHVFDGLRIRDVLDQRARTGEMSLQEAMRSGGVSGAPWQKMLKGIYEVPRNIFAGARDVARGEVSEGLRTGAFKWGEEMMATVEAQNRLEHFYAQLLNGMDPGAAAASVVKNHFNYSQLNNTHWVQDKVMRRMIPFMGWLRFNTARQFADLVAMPGGKQSQTLRAMADINRSAEDKGFIPPWLKERVTTPITRPLFGGLLQPSKDPESQRFLSASGFLPIEDALNRFPFLQGSPDWKRIFLKFGSQTSPILQPMLENAFGIQMWSGRKMSDIYQTPTRSARINNLIAASPLTRLVSTLRRVVPSAIGQPLEEMTGLEMFDDRKSAIDKTVSLLLGGLKITDIDRERGLSVEGRRLIEDELAPNNGVRTFSRLSVRPEDFAQLSPDELRLYSLYLYLLARSRRAIKEKREAKKLKGK